LRTAQLVPPHRTETEVDVSDVKVLIPRSQASRLFRSLQFVGVAAAAVGFFFANVPGAVASCLAGGAASYAAGYELQQQL
jgi:hypothetical protein